MKRRFSLILLLAIICMGLFAVSAQCLEFRVVPYLQNPSDNAVSIMWITNEPASGEVELGMQPAKLTGIAPALNVQPDICKARISGLKPGKRYYYRVKARSADGTILLSDVKHFNTLNPRVLSLKAVFYNDIHTQLPTYIKVAGLVSNFDYSLAIFNGDIWQDPNNRDTVINAMSTYVSHLRPSVPFVYVHGNHEWRGSFSNQMWTLFDLPNLNGQDEWGKQKWYYSFTQGPVHFVVLDGGEDEFKKMDVFQPYRQQQAEWLKQEIKSPEFVNAKFRVMVMHMPYPIWNSSAPCRQIFEPIVNSAGFDLAVCAHIHCAKVFGPCSDQNKNAFPFPTVTGGGPSLAEASVIELEATQSCMRATILNSDGKQIGTVSLQSRSLGKTNPK